MSATGEKRSENRRAVWEPEFMFAVLRIKTGRQEERSYELNILNYSGLGVVLLGSALLFFRPTTMPFLAKILIGIGLLVMALSILTGVIFNGTYSKAHTRSGISSILGTVFFSILLIFLCYLTSARFPLPQ